MLIKVKNLHGTSKPPAGYKSWLDYWQRKTGRSAMCANVNCNAFADVGGHVIKVDGFDKKRYIVPLCYNCNNDHDKEFFVNDYDMVPVNP